MKQQVKLPVLYQHQVDALDFFRGKKEIGLFYEMGLGKSAISLLLAAEMFKAGIIDSVLIVAPNGVHTQWAREQVPLWLSQVDYECQCLYGKGGRKEAYPFSDEPNLQVVVVNIETFSTPAKWKDIVHWSINRKTFIILDEATTIKNYDSQRTKRMLYSFNKVIWKGKEVLYSEVKTVARAVLSGTPLTESVLDIWSVMEFIRPNYFGRTLYSFKHHFGMYFKYVPEGSDHAITVPVSAEVWTVIKECTSFIEARAIFEISHAVYDAIQEQEVYRGPVKNEEELRDLLQPISMFRRLVDCVDMPLQIWQVRELDMPPDIETAYNEMRDAFITQYEGVTMHALSKLAVLIRLQQISSGFIKRTIDNIPTDNGVPTVSNDVEEKDILPTDVLQWIGGTNPKLEEMYNDIDKLTKPVIIVCKYTAEAARIYEDLKVKYTCCLWTGWKKVGSLDAFKEGKYQILIANIATIARGHNLQMSCSILFYSDSFSLERKLQTEGRIFRIGQKHTCEYFRYVYKNTVDFRILESHANKKSLLDYITGVTDIRQVV